MNRSSKWMALAAGVLWVAACGSDEAAFSGGSEATSSSAGGANTVASSGATGGMGSGGEGAGEPECPHTGPDLLDPETLPVCPMCLGGARCLPNSLIPPDFLSQLGDCDASNKCVPDDFIKTGGNFIPETCSSVAGGEGRCLSECLPDVAAQASFLPQDICPEFMRCVPCFDPISSEATGACALSCDPGPTTEPVALPGCCDGLGTCVPADLIPPDQVDALPQDTCRDASYVCAPTAAIADPNWAPDSCLTDTFIGGDQPGACLPDCLITGWESWLTSQSSCPDGHTCAPCNNPLNGNPTGACDFGQ